MKITAESPDLSGDPCFIFDFEKTEIKLVIDKGGKIEHEWKNTTNSEWASAWIGDAMIAGKLTIFNTVSKPCLIKLLNDHGFPVKGSFDIWYLRLADALVDEKKLEGIVSEDMDFFQPDLKSSLTGKKRIEYLKALKGKLRKDLLKRKIDVRCIHGWIK